MNPCSIQVNANAIAGKFSWNSNNWIGSEVGPCAVGYLFDPVAEWIENGKTFTQYNVFINNYAWEDSITAYEQITIHD